MGTHPIFESDFDCLTVFREMGRIYTFRRSLRPELSKRRYRQNNREREMPLLHRAQFAVNDIPDDLSPTAKVYYCEPTGEIFTSFEDYFERRVLLDTEVWSCSVTGKSNLTYDEARESESAARKTLAQVDKTLCRAVLHLFSKAPGRISAKNVSTEVFDAIKDKMLIGEIITHQRKKHKILNVKPITAKNGKKDSDEENKSPDTKKQPAKHYEYTLESVDVGDVKSVSGSECQRKMTIGLNKVVHYLIKIHGIRSETNKSWSVHPRATKKYRLTQFVWLDHFPGDLIEPVFEVIVPKEVKKKTKEPLGEVSNGKEEQRQKKKEKKISEKEKALQEEKRVAREKADLEEKKKQHRVALMEWKKPKADETLDDFVSFQLTAPKAIKTRHLPAELLGDAFQVIEFHRIFAHAYGEMQFSSHLRHLTLGDMEQVLYSNASSGVFCDMLFFYVQALRYCHENEINEAEVGAGTFPYKGEFRKKLVIDEEDGEEREAEEEEKDNNVAVIEKDEAEEELMNTHETFEASLSWPVGAAHSPEDCVEMSTQTVLWSVKCLGRPMASVEVDECTITEVLRMTLLITAAEMAHPIQSYRKQVRAGWDNEENPFIWALNEPLGVRIMQKLEIESVFELDPAERLWLIKLLNEVILCQADGRQVIDDAEDEIRLARKHLMEGSKGERARVKEYQEKLTELEAKAKEEETAEPDPIAMVSSTRSRITKKVKLTAREEVDEFISDNEQLKQAQEHQVKVLNEKLAKLELTIRAQLLGYDRFHRRYWLMASSPGVLVEVSRSSKMPKMANGQSWSCFTVPRQVPKPSLKKAENVDSDDEPLAGLIKKEDDVKMEVIEEAEVDMSKWGLEPHNTDETQWLVYTTEAEIKALIEGLNERGEREKELKSRIEKFVSIIDVREKSDYDFSSVALETVEIGHTQQQELSLRDYILDIEERIFNADFGDAFDDENERQLWRDYWTHGKLEKSPESEVIAIDFYDKIKEQLPPRLPLPIHLVPRQPNKELQNLAASLLLLARALKKEIVLRPLGNKGKEKKKRKKNESSWTNMMAMSMKNWEMSVMNATSAASLYLHVVHLDECINWDKSPENLRCSICKKKGDAQNMLICDECEKAFHTYCHKPKVKRIPEGDWFCKQCSIKHRQAASPVKKHRRTQVADDDELDPMLISDRPRKRNKVNYAE